MIKVPEHKMKQNINFEKTQIIIFFVLSINFVKVLLRISAYLSSILDTMDGVTKCILNKTLGVL